MKTIQRSIIGLFAASLATIFVLTTDAAPYQKGDVKLQSIGPLATGPDGVLFVSDPKAACIIAIKALILMKLQPEGTLPDHCKCFLLLCTPVEVVNDLIASLNIPLDKAEPNKATTRHLT